MIKEGIQFVIFKPLSYCFEETIGFNAKTSFASCQRLILVHYFHQRIFQEEMVISKNRNFLPQTLVSLPPRKPCFYMSCFSFFFFLEYHKLFKALQLTLFQHKDSKSFINIMVFFVGLAVFVVVTVLFSRLWISSSYFFIENPPSHIDIGVRLKLLQRRIQSPLKHLRWSFLRNELTADTVS